MGLSLCVKGQEVAQWSYRGFNRFRVCLVSEICIDLDKMYGFSQYNISSPATQGKSWDGISDPIIILLRHSDVDGTLSPDGSSAYPKPI